MKLDFSFSPHLRNKDKVENIMWTVVAALVPVCAVSVYVFGMYALWIIILSTASAVMTEALLMKAMKKENTINDGSAFITGMLLALTLPPTVPLWLPIVGAAFAIAIGKVVFGGLGANIFNPALVGRSFLVASWPVLMTTWAIDGITTATPLAIAKIEGMTAFASKNILYKSLLLGNVAGSIGETSALVLLACGVFLIFRKIIDWKIPFFYIGTVFAFSWLLGGDPVFHILAGGLFIGAFFMATDYVTNPMTGSGRIIFAVGCGILTVLIRLFSGMPGGVSYSILLMNALTPIIDRHIKPKRFGTK